jgi:ABC-type multidrug transport system ATPase subunit
VYGYDIRKDTDEIRESLGYCPQHDILFDNLTVHEHMYFFAKVCSTHAFAALVPKTSIQIRYHKTKNINFVYIWQQLRGIDGSLVENEIAVMLKKLNLEKKRDALSSSLSGGMKRRLSVGIAFLGNTKVSWGQGQGQGRSWRYVCRRC